MPGLLFLSLFLAQPSSARLGSEGDSCLAASDCADAFTCQRNTCVYRGEGGACSRTADCPDPLRCQEGVCRGKPVPRAPAQQAAGVAATPPVLVRDRPMWATGLSILLTINMLHGIVGSTLCSTVACLAFCWTPVIGPFIAAGTVSAGYPGYVALDILSGITQVLGLTFFAIGMRPRIPPPVKMSVNGSGVSISGTW